MQAAAQQLVFDLGHRVAYGRQDFLVAPSNQDAVAWIDRWPAGPAPFLVLHGPAACGKTHLAAVWRERTQAQPITADELTNGAATDILNRGHHFVIDPVDPWIGDRTTETTLFHLYNHAREQGKNILVTMRTAPAHLDFVLPDLASRLRASPAAPIHAPDETLLGAVLVKLFADRQLALDPDVLTYVLPRMERSFAAAQTLVVRADAHALAGKRAISIPLMRDILLEEQNRD